MLAAWVFDECDATGQQRPSAVLFSRALKPGSAACGGASDTYVPLAASSLQTGKAWTAGLNSLLTPLLYGASLVGQALWAAFWDLPPHPSGSFKYHRLIWGNTVVLPSLNSLKLGYAEIGLLYSHNNVFSVKYSELNNCVFWIPVSLCGFCYELYGNVYGSFVWHYREWLCVWVHVYPIPLVHSGCVAGSCAQA